MTADNVFITRLVLTAVTLALAVLLPMIMGSVIHRTAIGRKLEKDRLQFIMKLIRWFSWLLVMLLLISVWGINIKNLWLLLTGVFGIIAIGFFAVWSILSNVVAGLLILVSDPFRVGDSVEILPDNISGKLIDLKLFFVVLEDSEGNIFHVPNNLLFQKFLKKVKKGG